MDEREMRERFAAATLAHLATADRQGTPHVVPVVFALDVDTIYFAVDEKSKRTREPKRLRNIAMNPSDAALVEHYQEAWHARWCLRAARTGRVLEHGPDAAHPRPLLAPPSSPSPGP